MTASEPSVAELRALYAQARGSGRVRWIHLQGLALDDRSHTALLRALAGASAGAGELDLSGNTVVLDWTSVRECSAEGFALFHIVARMFAGAGAQVYVLPPTVSDVLAIVDAPEFRAGCVGAIWVDGGADPANRVVALGCVGAFASRERGTIAAFCASFERALSRLAMPADLSGLLNAIALEVVQNVKTHARASHAAILGLNFHRMRPGLVEIGVADDGRGITDSLLDQAAHRRMERYLDVSVVETLFQRNLSSRSSGSDDPNALAVGGFGALLAELFAKASVTVLLRSHRVLIELASDGRIRRSKTLASGVGTQLRIAVRLPQGSKR